MGTNVKKPASDLPAAHGTLVSMIKTLITGAKKAWATGPSSACSPKATRCGQRARDQRLGAAAAESSAPGSCRST